MPESLIILRLSPKSLPLAKSTAKLAEADRKAVSLETTVFINVVCAPQIRFCDRGECNFKLIQYRELGFWVGE